MTLRTPTVLQTVLLGAAILAASWIWFIRPQLEGDSEGEDMLDLTLVLSGPLEQGGGVITLIIRETPEAPSSQQTYELELSSIAPVVLVSVPVGSSYSYRFAGSSGRMGGSTTRFRVGSFQTGVDTPDAAVLYHHFSPGAGTEKWTLSHSRRLTAALSSASVEDLFPCQRMAGATICDASSLAENLPE